MALEENKFLPFARTHKCANKTTKDAKTSRQAQRLYGGVAWTLCGRRASPACSFKAVLSATDKLVLFI